MVRRRRRDRGGAGRGAVGAPRARDVVGTRNNDDGGTVMPLRGAAGRGARNARPGIRVGCERRAAWMPPLRAGARAAGHGDRRTAGGM